MKVCLDAGHGINTLGKRTPRFSDNSFIHEAEQNYPIMFKVKEYLEFNDIETVLTNNCMNIDMKLKKRVKNANNSNADIFVSIHKNATTGKWQNYAKGISIYIHKKGYNAEKLAKKLQCNLIDDTNMYNRGIKEWAGLYVTKYTKMPAVLLELGFMDYLEEAKQMKDSLYHDKFAKSITKGICEYFNIIAVFPINDFEKEYLEIKKLEKENTILKIKLEKIKKIVEG